MKRWLCAVMVLVILNSCAFAGGAHYHSSGDENVPKVSITVDDWLEPALLPDFLDAAKEYNVRLTLYPCGFVLKEEDRALWQRALDEGHEIGSHGFSHTDFSERGDLLIKRDFEHFGEVLDKVLGYHYEFLTVRLPKGGGWREGGSGRTGRACHAAGFDHVIFWTIDNTNDVDYAARKIGNGSILLMHANHHDLRFFRALMEKIKDRGLQYVTVSDLLGITARLIDDEPQKP